MPVDLPGLNELGGETVIAEDRNSFTVPSEALVANDISAPVRLL